MNEETKKEENPTNNVEKKFAVVMQKLTAVVRGPDKLKPVRRIPNDEVANLVDELFAEERATILTEVKEKLKALLKAFHEMEKSVKAKRDELEKLQLSKKDEFTKAANALFDKIENVGDIEKSYHQGLQEIVNS